MYFNLTPPAILLTGSSPQEPCPQLFIEQTDFVFAVPVAPLAPVKPFDFFLSSTICNPELTVIIPPSPGHPVDPPM